jgi:Uma2 family endonuclease
MKTTVATLPDNFTRMTDAEFFNFASQMENVRIERTKNGQIIIMPPTGGETGIKNGKIFGYVFMWNMNHNTGFVFDSSTGFTLPDGSVRSPDCSWISLANWNVLPIEDRRKFAPICPEFVVELMSENDTLLGWLINPKDEKAYIYRTHTSEIEEIDSFDHVLSGESVLPAFELDLSKLR